ncbi:MAG: RIP metalloprotease RseP [Candidatus Longimicrobiales bacterium M2_2A_002]
MVLTIAATLGVLGILILVHELGHFVAARYFDIHVSRFSIGLGPKLLAFQYGETEFRLSALPLGGYVKLTGMKEMDIIEGTDDAAATVDPDRTFAAKPAGVRAIVLAAGVAMNVVLGVVLFAGFAMARGKPTPSEPVVGNVVAEWLSAGTEDLASIPAGTRITRVGDQNVATMGDVSRAIMAAEAGDLMLRFERRAPLTITIPERARERQFLPVAIEAVSDAPPVVGFVEGNGAAARAGLRSGDRVLAIDGRPIATWQELARTVRDNAGRELDLRVQRDDGTIPATLTPATRRVGDRVLGTLGASLDLAEDATPRERVGPVAAVTFGFTQSWEIVTVMGSFVTGLFDGRHSPREIGGPVVIAQISGIASRAGLATLLFFAGILSINLAIMNILPIPALDGGHLALIALEKIRGRPAGERARVTLGRLGFAMVLLITLWGVTADVLRLLGI